MTALAPPSPAHVAVPDAVAPPPRHPRFPLLDGMRAVAVISVVAVHAATLGNGVSASLAGRLTARANIGVTIFFLISGFLLYRPMIAHRGGGGAAPAVADYAKRRFLRIYPAYWLVLTVLVVLPGVPRVIFGPWWPMYAIVHTLPVYHGTGCLGAASSCGLAQTWSLVVELTFYAALPVFALIAERATLRLTLARWLAAQLLALAVLSAASVVLQFVIIARPPRWFGASAAAYVLWFALGMGMAVVSVWARAQPQPPRIARLGPWAACALWTAAAAGYVGLAYWLPPTTFLVDRNQVMVGHVAYGLIAALLLLPAVFADRAGGAPRRLLAHPVMAWLGVVSYGIFLWHVAVGMTLVSHGFPRSFPLLFATMLVVSTLCAAASYYVVERPALRFKYRRLIPVRAQPVS